MSPMTRLSIGKTLCLLLLVFVSNAKVGGMNSDSTKNIPRNIIFLVGDGLGLVQLSASIHRAKEPTAFERFSYVGLQKVHCHGSVVTDSGASATAMACGVKTYLTGIGVDHDTVPQPNLFELAIERGMATGLVVTSSLVHATPAAFVAHREYRGLYEHIAIDITESSIDYLVGGGRFFFNERHYDDRDLVEELTAKGYYIASYDNMSFKKFTKECHPKSVYFTAQGEPPRRLEGRDYLPVAVAHGINCLSNSTDEGFLLVVEGSQIDYANHNNDEPYLVAEMQDFHETVRVALDFAEQNGETLVIVAGDHASGGIYIESGNPLKHKVKMRFSTRRHTADMVPVYAFGPGAENFTGIFDNTELFTKIRETRKF